jgi:antitoxin (DNA-binding transcriptional repressor) of toxin-antitoxin stability system
MKNKQRKLGSAIRETRGTYGATRKLSATEASRNFSEIVNRALYRGESFIIERAGAPVCEIKPAAPSRFTVADLADLMKTLPPIDEDYLRTVEELSRSQPTIPASPWEP